MPDDHPYDQLIEDLKQVGVIFAEGLTNEQLYHISKHGGFRFPSDLRAFLKRGVPIAQKRIAYDGEEYIDDRFPNWYESPLDILRKEQRYLLQGIYFDVKNNGFWMSTWGERPERLSERFAIVQRHVEAAPMMIPVCSHRFIPVTPCLAGNPVFSLVQTDIIHYGYNLEVYWRNEFINLGDKHIRGEESDYREIPFWSDFVFQRNFVIFKRSRRRA